MEQVYLELVKDVLETGYKKEDRTGVGTISKFGTQLRCNLQDGFPLLTTKKMFWKGVVEELLWFIKGQTNSKLLEQNGVNIWKGNSSKEFINNLHLPYSEGDCGPVYGFQWRHWGTEYTDCHQDYTSKGFDQLQWLVNEIKTNPTSRRLILSSWNVTDIPKMVLPPCHCLCQFNVREGYLDCQLYQRSADLGLGVPFNIASYALFTHIIALETGLQVGEFIHTMGDVHIYTNHIEPLKQQLTRQPYHCPKLEINVKHIEDYTFEDFTLHNYTCHPPIKMDMAI